MAKIRKTDPCPCGSGKHYKYCHGAPEDAQPVGTEFVNAPPKRVFLWLTGILVPLVLLASFFGPDTGSDRVWSEEHGHYHDAPILAAEARAAASVLPKSVSLDDEANTDPVSEPEAPVADGPKAQPVGTAPPGKIWDEIHGHWHDADAKPAQLRVDPDDGTPWEQDRTLRPPEGPVPEGKTWSTAHGHWHDNDAP